jgi:diadenosine tetraphosphate (Ap4A) HIT family hydrolase
MLSEQEIKQFKEQILQQIDSTFPEDKKAPAKQQIAEMNAEQFEEFLKQNNLIPDSETPSKQKCIFCSILAQEISYYKINENSHAIAILEINPVSKGHVIIIPKEHSDKIPEKANELSEEVSKKIMSELKPKTIRTTQANLFGHEILNIIPVYKNETEDSKRYKAEEKELLELQSKLEKKPEPKKIEKQKTEQLDASKMRLPRRIP